MSRVAARILNFAEPLAIFLLIECYIWVLRDSHRLLWIPILGCIVLSHCVRRERPDDLGFQAANLRGCLRAYAPLLAFLGLAGLAAGMVKPGGIPMPAQEVPQADTQNTSTIRFSP